jgi:cytochrome c oxidase cbb3-type subunit 3
MREAMRTGGVYFIAALLSTIAAQSVVSSQGPPAALGQAPPPDPAAIARGRQIFTQQCSFCHGADARGGAEGGSDLTRSTLVLQDRGGTVLGPFLRAGRPEFKMPPFPLPEGQAADLSTFLRSLIAPAGRGRGGPVAAVVGDALAGQAFFNGKGACISCHSVTGDLKGIGSRLTPATLQGRIVLPRGNGGYPRAVPAGAPNPYPDVPLRATVTLPGGEVHAGVVLSVSDFHVTVQDAAGARRTFTRRGEVPTVALVDPLQAHIDMALTLNDRDMHNLTAYLVTVK